MEIAGKTAIVTGAGRGIGRALALEFARNGASVVCVARRQHEIAETAAMIQAEGGEAVAVACDVTDRAQVDAMVATALDRFGRIDILFNNAGSFRAIGGLWEVDPDLWWHDATVNLRGPMLCCHAVLPHMIERDEGIILNMNGGGATVPLPGGSAYGSSKAALLRLTDTLARELERIGSHVLVMAMGPGLVRTEMTELQMDTEEGRRWIPSTQEAMDAGKHRPPEDCAVATMELIRNACPELNGRIFGVGMDFARVAAEASKIHQEDRHVMRGR